MEFPEPNKRSMYWRIRDGLGLLWFAVKSFDLVLYRLLAVSVITIFLMELWLLKIEAPWEWLGVSGQILRSMLYATVTGIVLYFFVGHFRDARRRRMIRPFLAENVYTIYQSMRHVLLVIEERGGSELLYNETLRNAPVLEACRESYLQLDERGRSLVSAELECHRRRVDNSIGWLISMGGRVEGEFTVAALQYQKCGLLPYFIESFLKGGTRASLATGKLAQFQRIAEAFRWSLQQGLQEFLTAKQRQRLSDEANRRPPPDQ